MMKAQMHFFRFQEMWDMLLTGEGYDKITPAEYAELKKNLPTNEDAEA
jgi:hypothetical protein